MNTETSQSEYENSQQPEYAGNGDGQGGCFGGKDHQYDISGTDVEGGVVVYIYKCSVCSDIVRQRRHP